MTNEKTPQYNKRNYTHRVVAIALSITICLCSYIPCLANTKVEIQANSGTGGTPFHGYSINTTVADSYIDNGAMFFSNAWNSLATNIAKFGSTISRVRYLIENTIANKLDSIITNQSTINNNINSIATLISTVNNSIGYVNGSLSGIRQDEQSILTGLNNVNWVSENITYGYYGTTTDAINQTNSLSQGAYKHIYIRVEFSNEIFSKALKLVFPVIPYNTMNLNNADYYIEHVYTPTNNMLGVTPISETKQRMYFYNQNHTSAFYFDGSGFTMSNGNYRKVLIFDISGTQNSYIYTNQSTLAYSLDSNSEDYYKLANYINLSKISTDDVVDAINNKQITSTFDDSDILDAINNLSLVDNDVKISVNVTNNDSQNVQDIIPFIRSFFDNNISLGDFITESGTVQNNWFSQQNQDIMNSLSGGYIDLYD